MELPRLYVVTDEQVVPNGILVPMAERILRAGVRMLQVRFKTTPRKEQGILGRELRALTSRYGALLIANDSPELALSIGADGVHLGAEDASPLAARALLGSKAVIGVSGYDDPGQVGSLGPEHAAYLGLASPWPSGTKRKAIPDETAFGDLVRMARVPVYAIGGITPERVGGLLDVGCHGVAVVGAIFGAPDPEEAVRAFLAALL